MRTAGPFLGLDIGPRLRSLAKSMLREADVGFLSGTNTSISQSAMEQTQPLNDPRFVGRPS